MNSEELIIKYFDGELSQVEVDLLFEKLKDDEVLKKEFEDYKSVFKTVTETKSVKIDEAYLINTVPNIRAKIEKDQFRKKTYRFAFALFPVFFAAILSFYIFELNKPLPEQNEVFTFDEEEKIILKENSDYFLDNNIISSTSYPSNIDSIYENSIVEELNSEEISEEIMSDDYSYTDFYELDPTDTEADKIYAELINKSFF